ncbi:MULTISPECIES: helix-turn-helix domain-containing protein [Streptosporangium]|uniref:Excisionase family DNA binding protein n=1 Tax=Streptosporangium brasiliense TaxID=47480 RepID=A0ABT9R468_9ACTN|nr:helix-turn-helix domain-containing protein [Streptosporangium brasiliense]MDP9864024.1 excisionase family DNA binding protein [Streptosporangium brasiliense]
MTIAAPDSVRLDLTTVVDPADMPLLLTVEEAARQLRIGRTQMWRLVTTGAVESVFIGRLRRVPIECLHEYVTNLLANGGQRQKTAA